MAGTSRGKQGFRDFSKLVTQAYRDLIESLRDGEEFSSQYVVDIFDQIFLAYVQEMTDIDLPNIPLWSKRAGELITNRLTDLFDRFDEQITEEEEEEELPSEETFIGDETITIRGEEFPIIDRMNAPTLRRAGRLPRNRVFPTLQDVEDYIFAEDWPYEYIQNYGGIEIIRRGSRIVGFRIWIG